MAAKKAQTREDTRLSCPLSKHEWTQCAETPPSQGPREALGLKMPRKHRLSRADFLGLDRKRSRRVHGTYFSLVIAPLAAGVGPKAACVVSKKVAKRAVDRNKIERRVRGILRPFIARMQGPRALILYAKREVLGASYIEMQRDIQKLIEIR